MLHLFFVTQEKGGVYVARAHLGGWSKCAGERRRDEPSHEKRRGGGEDIRHRYTFVVIPPTHRREERERRNVTRRECDGAQYPSVVGGSGGVIDAGYTLERVPTLLHRNDSNVWRW